MRTLHLHVGKHKTGTTSIQHYALDHAAALLARGVAVVRGNEFVLDLTRRTANSSLMADILIRPELETAVRLRGIAPRRDPSERLPAARAVNAALHAHPGAALCVSAEAFSFLRTPGERDLYDLMFEGFELRPILFVREAESWMTSWRAQTARRLEAFLTDDPRGTLFDYGRDSWLLDDAAIARFHGPATTVLRYETCLGRDGSVIPAFLRALGLDPGGLPDWRSIWKNRSSEKGEGAHPGSQRAR